MDLLRKVCAHTVDVVLIGHFSSGLGQKRGHSTFPVVFSVVADHFSVALGFSIVSFFSRSSFINP